MSRGYFLTLEGIDGSGKSTQAELLSGRLRQVGVRVCHTREPGGTALGQRIRELLLAEGQGPIGAWSELALYLADRAQHMQEVVRPALARGEVVVCERYHDSTIAYQAFGRKLPRVQVMRCCHTIAPEVPEVTVLLQVAPEIALARLGRRRDRLEAEGQEFLTRVGEGYRYLSRREPGRFLVVEGEGDPEATFALLWGKLVPRLCQAGYLQGGEGR